MRQTLTGRSTSVPSVRPGAPDPRWNSGGAIPNANAAPAQGGGYGGGSFLGTAAASAAGVIGGALLLNSISSMFGNHGGSAFAAVPQQGGSPWDNRESNASGSELARDAGINDIGGSGRGDSQPATLFGNDDDADLVNDLGGDSGGDFGGDFSGGDSA
jgi:hypothetical protein